MQSRPHVKPTLHVSKATAIECSIGYRRRHHPEEAALIRVDVGTFSPPVVLDLAASSGLLDAAGLEVTEHPVPSSPAQFRSLADGDLQVALTSPDNVLAYRFNPHNPLGGSSTPASSVPSTARSGSGSTAGPGFTADDLRGARVGVDVPHSGFALALYALADRLGVRRDEYELVTLGSTPKRLQALLAGECDATMLNAGNELLAEAAGCVRLAGVTDHFAPYLGTVVAVVGEEHLETASAPRSRPDRDRGGDPRRLARRRGRRVGPAHGSGSTRRSPAATSSGCAAPTRAWSPTVVVDRELPGDAGRPAHARGSRRWSTGTT